MPEDTDARRRRSPRTREDILDAACDVVIEAGAQSLTLDAVYKRAGISKGGLLYHFPSKEALLDAMIARYMTDLERAEATTRSSLDGKSAAATRTAIRQAAASEPGGDRLGSALLAAVANDLERLAPLRPLVRGQFEALKAERLPLPLLATVELAVIGLSFLELLRIAPFGAEERSALLEAMEGMIDEAADRAAKG